MKNEDKMIDALLQEHARKGEKDDSEFIASLEQRLDEEAGVVSITQTRTSSSNKAGIGLGIAAALTIAAVGFYGWNEKRNTDLAMNASYDVPEQEAATVLLEPEGAITEGAIRKRKDDSAMGATLADPGKKRPGTLNKYTSPTLSVPAAPAAPIPPVATEAPIGAPAPMADAAEMGDKEESIPGKSNVARAKSPAKPSPVSKAMTESLEKRSKDSRSIGNRQVKGGFSQAMVDFRDDIAGGKRKGRGVTHGNRYGSLTDNVFKSPWKDPLSTFSVDVDTASYTNVRRMIQSGQAVPSDAVRIEEMINYFNYAYPQPDGKHPFSVNVETASCPWNAEHRLVKIGLKGKDIIREERPASNLVFLLDVSGSMNSQDKLPLLVDSMKILLKELNADDSVSIVVYAGAQGLALPPTYVDENGRKTILNKLNNFRSGGSTNGGAGITLAYKMAKKHFVKGGVNRVILGTDGDFNVGTTSTDSLVSMVEREAKSGVFMSVLGFGQGNLNDNMLEKITNKGNGNYFYIDNLREGRKVFLDDMMGTMVTIAKDVKIQVEFNPAKVKSYRLIGYANRMLKKEDFKNKLIDAGEIGSGHTVTALYEVVPGNAQQTADVDDLEFQKKKATPKQADREVVDSPHSMVVKLAYKQPDATKETESTYFRTRVTDNEKTWQKASDDFKFASSVSLFGMLQRRSEHAGQGTYQLVRQLAEQGRGDDSKGLRTEFSDLVRKVAK